MDHPRKLLVLHHMPATLGELLERIQAMGGMEEIEIRVAADMLSGKHPDLILLDENYDALQRLKDFIPSEPYIEPLDNRPRSKGDRHRNKRYRWS